jgi:hypothetical protein
MTFDEAEANLEKAILAFEKAATGEGSLLTGWVLIGEFMDSDGMPRLSAWAADGLPYWRIDGMIDAASDIVVYETEDEDLD